MCACTYITGLDPVIILFRLLFIQQNHPNWFSSFLDTMERVHIVKCFSDREKQELRRASGKRARPLDDNEPQKKLLVQNVEADCDNRNIYSFVDGSIILCFGTQSLRSGWPVLFNTMTLDKESMLSMTKCHHVTNEDKQSTKRQKSIPWDLGASLTLTIKPSPVGCKLFHRTPRLDKTTLSILD